MIDRLRTALSDRYRIEGELGAGGMATVYLAADLRHDRSVALKVLRPELSAVIGAERFLAEIRTTANLQHPHILPLFDSGEADGLLFYVMPLVDGESLRDRLDRERQLPIKEALRIADSVASALDYAHRQGVVHRDIKPANILMHDGQALVADFGIALALTAAGSSGRMTETGLSLGTPHYMSPEQASGGGTVDPRSDVYALGCVLYEMLVGDPPFPGSTPQAVLAKVLTMEPERTRAHRASIPPHLDAVVARSMERIPADRFESLEEFRAALADEDFRHGPEADLGAAAIAGAGRGWKLAVGVLSILVLALTGVALGGRSGSSGTGVYRVLGLGTEAGAFNPAYRAELSPDGRLLVGVDTLGLLHAVTLDGLQPPLLPDLEGARVPRFSPDGTRIGFVSVNGAQPYGAELFWIPATGASTATRIGPLPAPAWAWGLNGEVYFTLNGEVHRYPSPGAPAEPVAQPDEMDAEVLQVLPGGQVLVETPTPAGGTALASLDPSTGELKVYESQPDPVGTVDARFAEGYLFWTNLDGVLLAARFDPDGDGVRPPSIQLETGVARASEIGSIFSAASDGSVVLGLGAGTRAGVGENLAWVDLDGDIEVLHEPWAEEFGDLEEASISEDGRWIAVEVDVPDEDGGIRERGEIWILDALQKQSYRLTFQGEARGPQWLPDGRVAYIRDLEDGTGRLVAQPYDRSGAEEVLSDPGRRLHSFDLLPDGSGALLELHESNEGTENDDLRFQRFDGSQPTLWLGDPFDETDPSFSPDGRWVAYVSNETGRPELYVRSFPTPGRPWRLSDEGVRAGAPAAWGPEGDWIYFVTDGQMVTRLLNFDDGVRIQGSGEFFSMGPFEGPSQTMDAAGNRFLLVVEPTSARGLEQRIHLSVFEEIERRSRAASGR